MTPPAIVRAAIEKGLNLIAVCDHNAAGNARATQRAADAAPRPVSVLAGMEITTAEEVHVLGLFPSADAAEAAADRVRATLPDQPPSSDAFGRQSLLNADGECIGIESKMLAGATTFSLEQAITLIHQFAGLAIASHVDRPSFSVISQLGIFPERAGLDAIEISPIHSRDARSAEFERFGLAAITGSDSHFPSDVGFVHTDLWMEAATLDEVRLALTGRDGRRWARA